MLRMDKSIEHPDLVTTSPYWALVRLIRPFNVAIIGLTMWTIQQALVVPDHVPAFDSFTFWISASIMMLLAAGGNVINDYFDIQEDAINKPRRALVGRVVSRRKTLFFHHILTGTAVTMALAMAWVEQHVLPLVWTIGIATLLWGYSPWFKRRFLRGNLVISAIVGQLSFWCIMGEWVHLSGSGYMTGFYGIGLIVYALLSFLITFLREITKDLQDQKGDAQFGHDTLAVRWGSLKTRKLLQWLHAASWIPLLFAGTMGFLYFPNRWAVMAFLLPYAAAHIQLIRGHIHSVSAWQKMTLAGGVAFLFLQII